MNLSKIDLYFSKEKKPEDPAEPVSEGEPAYLSVEDATIPKGGAGYFTNCALNARFDLMEILQEPCTVPETPSPN
jgi:hypothetical protein